jgi:lipopolysaccharide transport system permease protein
MARSLPIVRVEPSLAWSPLDIRELWEYRELLYFLVWREIKVRYKQTALGATWAILQPVTTMVVFSLFFGRLAKISSDGVPYPIFSFAALVPWTFFAAGVTQASMSLVQNARMVKKIYFPRFALPISAVLAGILDFAIALIVLFVMMVFYGILPTANTLWIPLLIALALTTSLGAGLWLAAWNVEFRDVRYVVPFIVQSWLFLTPVAYPSSLLTEPWRFLYGINPMVGVVEGFRWALLGTNRPPGVTILVSTVAALLLLVSGAFYFRRMEKGFADII